MKLQLVGTCHGVRKDMKISSHNNIEAFKSSLLIFCLFDVYPFNTDKWSFLESHQQYFGFPLHR